jgi:hypothetical protein
MIPVLLLSWFKTEVQDYSDQVEMGGACGTYAGEEECVQGFGGETYRKETTWITWAWMEGLM